MRLISLNSQDHLLGSRLRPPFRKYYRTFNQFEFCNIQNSLFRDINRNRFHNFSIHTSLPPIHRASPNKRQIRLQIIRVVTTSSIQSKVVVCRIVAVPSTDDRHDRTVLHMHCQHGGICLPVRCYVHSDYVVFV